MKKILKIGHGWQNTVYDIGSDRVLKKTTNILSQFLFIRAANISKHRDHTPITTIRAIIQVKRQSTIANRFIHDNLSLIGGEKFGNPYFISTNKYTQDKAEPLIDALMRCSVAQVKEIVNSIQS